MGYDRFVYGHKNRSYTLDNQHEESGWWALGMERHPPTQVSYWSSPITSWTKYGIMGDIGVHVWIFLTSSNYPSQRLDEPSILD